MNTETSRRKAVVLVSGGLDSSTVLSAAIADGWEAHALTIVYGQRHEVEVAAATRICADLGAASHKVLNLPLQEIAHSALTGHGEVPKNEDNPGIPTTYVPARNTIFLSLALAYAETLGASAIFIGVSSVDYSGYPDCRPEFVRAFEELARVATKDGVEGNGVKIIAPLIKLSKVETIELGLSLGVDYSLTHSCYDPSADGQACGACDSCRIRAKAFADLNLRDPAIKKPAS